MDAAQTVKHRSEQKAHRLVPDDEFSSDEFEKLAGNAADMIRAGCVQYWQSSVTVGVFTVSAPDNVWHVQVHLSDDDDGTDVARDIKAILNAFWDAESPEYITAHAPTTWGALWLMREAGFQQVGVLPLSTGPVITMGWRKCH